MAESLSRRPKAILALGAAVISMCAGLFALSPQSSEAFTTTNFCEGQTLAAAGRCVGAERTFYAMNGRGDQHVVCLYASFPTGYYGWWCSGGPGQGVFAAVGFSNRWSPAIYNAGNSWNVVHGRAYTE